MKKLIQNFFFSTNLNKKRNTSENYLKIIASNKYDIVFNIGAQTTNKNNTSDKVLANTFSNAHFILIEPLITLIPDEKHNEIINREYKSFNVKFDLYDYCLSSKSNKVNFYIKGGKSSYYKSTEFKKQRRKYKKVVKTKTTTFDTKFVEFIYKNRNKKILMKIDTEGSELDILKGAKKSLKYIDTIIAEVSNIDRFEGGATMFEINQFLSKQGMYLANITKAIYNNNNQYIYFDCLFSKKDLKSN